MNHCAALSGSSIVGGMSASRLEKRFTLQVRDLVHLKNSGDRASLRWTESIRVRAVSTDSRHASVGERARRPQNVDGDFVVDRTCIDCDVCRWMAPTVYSRKDGQSAVHHQPTSDEERRKALQVTSGTSDVEIKLDGEGTWNLGSDVELILTRGHTKGHVVLLLKDKGVLFSGDHLFVSSMSGEVTMSRAYVFFSVSAQLKSIENLLNYDFTWLLPGHGRRRKFESIVEKNAVLEDLVQRERQR